MKDVIQIEQANRNQGDVTNRYVLPGNYAVVERYEGREVVVTFQLLSELHYYLRKNDLLPLEE